MYRSGISGILKTHTRAGFSILAVLASIVFLGQANAQDPDAREFAKRGEKAGRSISGNAGIQEEDKNNAYTVTHTNIDEGTYSVLHSDKADGICVAPWADMRDAFPFRRPIKPLTAISNVQEKILSRPPFSAYSPLGGYPDNPSSLPALAVKSNLLYAVGTLTPNLAVEIGLGGRASLVFSVGYNTWNLDGSVEDNAKLVHLVLTPEVRYWLCERFNGHFFGFNPFYNRFNISGKDIPFVGFENDYRYEGDAWGAGINYGYQFALGKRWGLELSVGAGVAYMKYDTFDRRLCGDQTGERERWYIGPTRAAINLVFLIK